MAKPESRHVIVTGGAGYIGSMLTAELLRQGNQVTVIDNLLFGGESLLGFTKHTGFNFIKGDLCEPGTLRQAIRTDWQRPSVLIHLSAIVGFPACQAVGRQAAFAYNVEAVKRTYDQAEALGVQKFIFSSTYSVYGQSEKDNVLTEDSPLNPHSLYAETKVAAEEWLWAQTEKVLIKALDFPFGNLIWIISPNAFRSNHQSICSGCLSDSRTHHLPAWLFAFLYSCF